MTPPSASWPYRLAIAGWLALGIALGVWSGTLARPLVVVAAVVWTVGAGLLGRRLVASFFGPVLVYEAVRLVRRRRAYWLRVGYAAITAAGFAVFYVAHLGDLEDRPFAVEVIQASAANEFFEFFTIAQFAAVCLITPAAVAGAITDEKQRRTLPFVLATDLRDREIIFGKLAARLGGVFLLLLAGLPILALLQLYGGIDLELAVAAFVATAGVAVSLAVLSMAISVVVEKTTTAVVVAYAIPFVYVLVSAFAQGILEGPGAFDLFGYAVEGEELAYPFVAGNPFLMTAFVDSIFPADLWTTLTHFLIWHATATVLLLAWAARRLRPLGAAQTLGGDEKLSSRRRVRRERPPRVVRRPDMGDQPIAWREAFVQSGRAVTVGRALLGGLVLGSAVPVLMILIDSFDDGLFAPPAARQFQQWSHVRTEMEGYVRVAGVCVATLVFLAGAAAAAGSIVQERERNTYEALLTTPLTAREIVWGKWLGVMLGLRWGWVWLFAIWVMGVALGGVHPLWFLAAAVSLVVYTSGFVWIGLYCSIVQRSTIRAVSAAIPLGIFAGGGYYAVLFLTCFLPNEIIEQGSHLPTVRDELVQLASAGSPPIQLGLIPNAQLRPRKRIVDGFDALPKVPIWIGSVVIWGGLSWFVSRRCVRKLEQVAGRAPGQ